MYWKSGKQNQVSRSTTEAEFYALLEGITEVEFLQDIIHFAYKVDKRIFNCKNALFFCDNSSPEKITISLEPIARTKDIEVLISGINNNLPKKESKFTTLTLKIKLLISLPKALLGRCLKKLRKVLD
jgi:hypothetical protein